MQLFNCKSVCLKFFTTMPNLRKKSTVLTYNDDAIYRAIENQRKIANNKSKTSKLPNVVKKEESGSVDEDIDKIPEFVYASDGRKFYPCLFCCHAFAIKELQMGHMQQCSFRVPEISLGPQNISGKVEQISKPKTLLVRSKKTGNTHQTNKPTNKTQHFKLHPKEIVQKSKHFQLNTVVNNGAIKIVQRPPKKSAFPKIKFRPLSGNLKLAKIHPGLEGQISTFIKQEKNFKQRPYYNQCPHCNIIFNSAASLLRHKRENHMFPKIFVSADKLNEYDEMYKNSDMSKCTICSKPVTKVRWSRHLQTHVHEKKYLCGVCKKTFGRKDHLNVHEKTHLVNVGNPFVNV